MKNTDTSIADTRNLMTAISVLCVAIFCVCAIAIGFWMHPAMGIAVIGLCAWWIGSAVAQTIKEIRAHEGVQSITWEDDDSGRIRGRLAGSSITLFIIDRNPSKPYRGRMTGAVIPDEDESPDGLLSNALITWLQGCAAPRYLKDFEGRLKALRSLNAPSDK